MKEAGKSLGQFVASVLEAVNAATYVPAGVLVGGSTLVGKFYLDDTDRGPVQILAAAPSPTFNELAVFIGVVALVAAILDPIQFFIVRLLEGHIRIPLVSLLLEARQRSLFWFVQNNRDAAHEGVDRRRRVFRHLEWLVTRGSEPRPITGRWSQFIHIVLKLVPNSAAVFLSDHLVFDSRRNESNRDALFRWSNKAKRWPTSQRRVVGTRIGNVIRSYEDEANDALAGIPFPLDSEPGQEIQSLLPFAYFAIPETTANQHDHFRSQLLTNASLLFVVPVLALGFFATLEGTWQSIVVALCGFVEVATYVGARSAADGYGQMLLAIARQYASGEFRRMDTEETGPFLVQAPVA